MPPTPHADGTPPRHVNLDDLPSYHDKPWPTDPRAIELIPPDYKYYGDMSKQDFYDKFWDASAHGWKYPPSDGFSGPPAPNTLRPGDVIDRFGNPGGRYASPADTLFPDRAIPPTSLGSPYHQYEVVKPLPPSVTEGPIAPWFEMPGGGQQYHFDETIEWYLNHGFLKEIKP